MDLVLDLQKLPGKALYRCLADQLTHCISVGRLQSGESLPPTRELSRALGISRYTVVRAYNELISRGQAEVSSTSGTFVTGKNVQPQRIRKEDTPAPAGQISEYADRLLQQKRPHGTSGQAAQLNFGGSPGHLLPVRKWQHILLGHSSASARLSYQPDAFGYPELRRAIADYLRRTKGINCSFEQVIVFSQTQNALNLLCRLLLSNGDRIAVEEPGFGSIKSIAFSQDLEIQPVALDEDGAQFGAVKGQLQAIYATPAHHDPTGTVMSLERRKQLLELAWAKQAWIIEDDFDSDFHYGSKPLPPLAALDTRGSVIYLSSFWKPLYPLTAMGFIVVPPALIPLLRLAKVISEPNSEALEHLVLADFIADGSLERHLQKLRKVYSKQRSSLLLNLKQAFKETIHITKHSAGTHQLIRFDLAGDEDTILACASASGLGLRSTREYYLSAPPAKEFLLNFTAVSPDSAAEVVRRFREALRRSR